jgi:hypothetical protein
MKRPRQRKAKHPIQPPPALIERKLPHRRFIEFPRVKGKTVSKIEMFTTPGFHSITIDFDDQTAFVLTVEPYFTIEPSFRVLKKGNEEVIEEGPLIRSETRLP